MANREEQSRIEAVRKVRHRKMVSGETAKIRKAAGRRLMASAMRQLEEGAILETDVRNAKSTKRMGAKHVYETAGAAREALRSGVITPEVGSKIAKRLEREISNLKRAILKGRSRTKLRK